jgi:hypothetical protein
MIRLTAPIMISLFLSIAPGQSQTNALPLLNTEHMDEDGAAGKIAVDQR